MAETDSSNRFQDGSVLGEKNLFYLEWPLPVFGLISPTVFLPESFRPSNVSMPFKLVNQVTILSRVTYICL
jgi:hypothetical protein